MGDSCNRFKRLEIITEACAKHGGARSKSDPENGLVPKLACDFDNVNGLRYIWYHWKEDILEILILSKSLTVMAIFALKKSFFLRASHKKGCKFRNFDRITAPLVSEMLEFLLFRSH